MVNITFYAYLAGEQFSQLQGEKTSADMELLTLQQQVLQLQVALQQQQQAAAAQQHSAWAAAEVEKLQRDLAAERGKSSELEADVNAKADELEALKDELRAAKEQLTNGKVGMTWTFGGAHVRHTACTLLTSHFKDIETRQAECMMIALVWPC